jgi:glycosyltransferase involved in cell wall biosynthesis
MKRGLQAASAESSVIHNHGLWQMANIYPGRVVRGSSCLLMLSPRGMMDPWAWRYHHYRKRLLLLAGQAAALRATTCFHATAPMEAEFIRRLGFRNPIAVIHNGVTLPDLDGPPQNEQKRTLLFLSRIHPKKGVDVLLRAWRNVQDRFHDWNLCVCGPDCNGHLSRMRRLAESINTERVTFTGMIPEERKSGYYRSAQLYVLPTHNDNWAVTVADALAHAVPAIVSRGAPWSGLEQYGCGWWIENTVDMLTDCLRSALALPPSELAEKGRRGRCWMAREFSWPLAGQMMHNTYRWLVHGGPAPQWVLM